MSNIVNAYWLGPLIFFFTLLQTSGESFWGGLVTYDPPIAMEGGDEPGNAGVPISGFQFRSESTTNGYAQVTFQISSILFLSNRATPMDEIKTLTDLRRALDGRLRNDPQSTNYTTSIVKFDGRDAVAVTRPISNARLSKWYHGVYFIWLQQPVWQKSELFSVHVTAEKRAMLDRLVASLKSVKIRKTTPPAKLATDGMQLGITQAETRNFCGQPLRVIGPTETYITEKFLVEVSYDSGRSDSKVNLIAYSKVRDPQKAAAASDREARAAQMQTLPPNEAQRILQRYSDQGKLKWAPVGDNRWRRTDGAMAALTKGGLIIATAEIWPRIRLMD